MTTSGRYRPTRRRPVLRDGPPPAGDPACRSPAPILGWLATGWLAVPRVPDPDSPAGSPRWTAGHLVESERLRAGSRSTGGRPSWNREPHLDDHRTARRPATHRALSGRWCPPRG